MLKMTEQDKELGKRMLLNELIRLHNEYNDGSDIFYINIYSIMHGYALSKDIPYNIAIHNELIALSKLT